MPLTIVQEKILPQIPFKGMGRKLESLCRKALHEYNMLDNVSSLAVALSGGKDSLTLLFLLHAINGRGFPKFDLHAIHISGEFSCGASISEGYTRRICHELGIPLTIRYSAQKLETLECYSCSRERRKLLFSAAKELGCTTIAFGHHQDDMIQTLLLNLAQKGEFEGNHPKVPMVHYGITIIRPLIYISEEDIKTFAKDSGFARITCQCPVGQHSKRKKVEEHLKAMEKDFPHLRNNLALACMNYGSKKALKPFEDLLKVAD